MFDIHKNSKQIDVLLFEWDAVYELTLKQEIEPRLAVAVTILLTTEIARKVLTLNPGKFFIGITSILNLDSSEFEKVDLLGEFGVSVM